VSELDPVPVDAGEDGAEVAPDEDEFAAVGEAPAAAVEAAPVVAGETPAAAVVAAPVAAEDAPAAMGE
jgi:precorrin isomerase